MFHFKNTVALHYGKFLYVDSIQDVYWLLLPCPVQFVLGPAEGSVGPPDFGRVRGVMGLGCLVFNYLLLLSCWMLNVLRGM